MDRRIPQNIPHKVTFGYTCTFYVNETRDDCLARGGGMSMVADRHRFIRRVDRFEILYKQCLQSNMRHSNHGRQRECTDPQGGI